MNGNDTKDTPSGPHQTVSKNGKDQIQDRELRDLMRAEAAASRRVHRLYEAGLGQSQDARQDHLSGVQS